MTSKRESAGVKLFRGIDPKDWRAGAAADTINAVSWLGAHGRVILPDVGVEIGPISIERCRTQNIWVTNTMDMEGACWDAEDRAHERERGNQNFTA